MKHPLSQEDGALPPLHCGTPCPRCGTLLCCPCPRQGFGAGLCQPKLFCGSVHPFLRHFLSGMGWSSRSGAPVAVHMPPSVLPCITGLCYTHSFLRGSFSLYRSQLSRSSLQETQQSFYNLLIKCKYTLFHNTLTFLEQHESIFSFHC